MPQSATFVSDRTGWVLGQADACPTYRGDCTTLARTRDGGRTWDALVGPGADLDSLRTVRFANLRDGFVTGSALLATHDGGGSWHVLKGFEDAQDVEAAAGRVWVQHAGRLSSGPVGGGRFVLEGAPSDTVSFVLHGATVVVTRRSSTALYVGGHGREFRPVSTPCSSQAEPSVGLASDDRWLLVCGEGAGLGHQEKSAYRSEDAGRHWAPAGSPPPRVGSSVFPTDDGDFVVDHQEVAVYRGGTWTVALESNGGLSEGGFESAALGFAIGGFNGSPDTEMKLTRDAGRTWSTVRF